MAIKQYFNTIKHAAWLGWQTESNWTNPFIFAIYSIIRPISISLILVVMYLVITQGKVKTDFFAFMFVGNAFYMFISGALEGIAVVIHQDREHFQVLKYIFISTNSIYAYLFGRSLAKTILATTAVIITLIFGKIFLKLPLYLSKIDFLLLLISSFLGWIIIASMGILLAGIALITAKRNFFLGEAIGSIFYLLCGVVFPINTLPPVLEKLAKFLPFTYWLEAIRRSLIPQIKISSSLENFNSNNLLLILIFSSFILIFISTWVFKKIDLLVRKNGIIDMITSH